MANITGFRPFILLLVILSFYVEMIAPSGTPPAAAKSIAPNKFTRKTVKTKGGDLIDCVDIYKQPAFENPLLRNHTIQMRPSWYPQNVIKRTSSFRETPRQALFESGDCPEGTIPVLRTQTQDEHTIVFPSDPSKNDPTHEFALLRTDYEVIYLGAIGTINIWNQHVEPNEFSSSKIMLKKDAESIHVGYMINQQLLKDTKTRLFLYWAGADGKGCYNLQCPGFVQITTKYPLGAYTISISQYGGDQYASNYHVFKDNKTGDWWFRFQDENIGYWPSGLFNTMKNSANTIEWGGEIINSNPAGHHTTTQMGSGHFSHEGWRRASLLCNIQVIDQDYRQFAPKYYNHLVTKPNCYDMLDCHDTGNDWDYHLFFGGPGFGPNCQI